MDKVVLLKTQLAEAAKFSRSKQLGHKRLAVILLDNFVEIQLSAMIRQKFHWDGMFNLQDKKYSHEKKIRILNHYDELLSTCVKENIISPEERRLLTYCHDIRNNLYHKGDEEKLLIQIAIITLYEIILRHQPTWKTTRPFTSWSKDTNDPYNPKKGRRPRQSWNSEDDWKFFLKKYFLCVDKRAKSGSKLLSDFLISKIRDTKSAIAYFEKEFSIFFPSTKDWSYNEFLLYYSFLNNQKNEIEKIKELKDIKAQRIQYDDLFSLYKRNWRYRKATRLKTLEQAFKKLAEEPIEKSIEKFVSYKDEVKIIHDAFQHAARDFDSAVELAIDMARDK